MNVLFVVDSLNEGGAGRVVARLASFFCKENVKTSVLPIFDNRINYKIDPDVVVYSTFEFPLEHSVLERIELIKECAVKSNADVVISLLSFINIYAILAGLGKKWKTVISERNNPYVDPANPKIRFVRKYLYLLADGCVFQTEDAKKYFSKKIQNKSVVIPNPVADDISEPYVGLRTKRIVSAGRLTKQKNYSMALDALSDVLLAHPDYVYEIYGQGEDKEDIIKKIEQLGLKKQVKLKGHVTNLIEKIKDASVFVLSSDYEGISNSLIEAMAVGIPVVSTDHPIGGARLLIRDGINGFLVPVGDSKKLGDKVNYLIEYKEKAQEISRNAICIKEEYSITNIGKTWLEWIINI